MMGRSVIGSTSCPSTTITIWVVEVVVEWVAAAPVEWAAVALVEWAAVALVEWAAAVQWGRCVSR